MGAPVPVRNPGADGLQLLPWELCRHPVFFQYFNFVELTNFHDNFNKMDRLPDLGAAEVAAILLELSTPTNFGGSNNWSASSSGNNSGSYGSGDQVVPTWP